MSVPVLYTYDPSPPSRGVLLAATSLGVVLDLRQLKVDEGEHLKPEFLKLNPLHTVPTLDDNGFILWDSHAIMVYLADKYGNNDAIYPKDPQLRAKVHQFLQFDNGFAFTALRSIVYQIMATGNTNIDADKMERLNSTYEMLEKLLEDRNWLVGDSYTLADISLVTTVSSMEVLRPFDKYPNIKAWVKRCEDTLPGYAEKNIPGMKVIHEAMGSKLPNPF